MLGSQRLTRALGKKRALTFLAWEMCFLFLRCTLLIQSPTGVYRKKFTCNKGSWHPGDWDWSLKVQKQMYCLSPNGVHGSWAILPCFLFSLLPTEGNLRNSRQWHSFNTWVFGAQIHCQEVPLCFDYLMGPMQFFCLCLLRFLKNSNIYFPKFLFVSHYHFGTAETHLQRQKIIIKKSLCINVYLCRLKAFVAWGGLGVGREILRSGFPAQNL